MSEPGAGVWGPRVTQIGGRCRKCGAHPVTLWAPERLCAECDEARIQRELSTWISEVTRRGVSESSPPSSA